MIEVAKEGLPSHRVCSPHRARGHCHSSFPSHNSQKPPHREDAKVNAIQLGLWSGSGGKVPVAQGRGPECRSPAPS